MNLGHGIEATPSRSRSGGSSGGSGSGGGSGGGGGGGGGGVVVVVVVCRAAVVVVVAVVLVVVLVLAAVVVVVVVVVVVWWWWWWWWCGAMTVPSAMAILSTILLLLGDHAGGEREEVRRHGQGLPLVGREGVGYYLVDVCSVERWSARGGGAASRDSRTEHIHSAEPQGVPQVRRCGRRRPGGCVVTEVLACWAYCTRRLLAFCCLIFPNGG